jgi:NAD(P)-dependent dehydrogenase (short-subunit alcohol dehydrogenase family)
MGESRQDRYRAAFAGKHVLVTGSSRGIGAAAARILADAGATVLLVARNADNLAEVKAQIEAAGGRAHTYPTDLSDLDEVDALVDKVLAEHGGVDILVHNAARSIRRLLVDSLHRFHDFRRTMELNYFSPVRLTLGLLPSLRERRGHVSLVLTMGVLIPGPYFAAYLASKAALGAFGDSLAAEFRHEGLRVSSVYLPLVRTEMMAPTREYQKRTDIWSPRRAAHHLLDAIVDERRRVITPAGHWFAFSNLFRPRSTTRVLSILRQTFPPRGTPSRYPMLRRVLKKTLGGSPI